MPMVTALPLDVRGKSITTYIACQALTRLSGLADGESLELLTDAREEIDNDPRAFCRTRGQEITAATRTDGSQQYTITKRPLRPSGKRYATVISDPGLEELLSPLAFARAGLTRAGHIPAQEKLRQLQALGARLYACAGSMQHYKVARTDLAFDDVTIAEYLTFMEIMAGADVSVFLQ